MVAVFVAVTGARKARGRRIADAADDPPRNSCAVAGAGSSRATSAAGARAHRRTRASCSGFHGSSLDPTTEESSRTVPDDITLRRSSKPVGGRSLRAARGKNVGCGMAGRNEARRRLACLAGRRARRYTLRPAPHHLSRLRPSGGQAPRNIRPRDPTPHGLQLEQYTSFGVFHLGRHTVRSFSSKPINKAGIRDRGSGIRLPDSGYHRRSPLLTLIQPPESLIPDP